MSVHNGPELSLRYPDQRAYLNKAGPDSIRPGRPTDKALIESSNGRFRQECLNVTCQDCCGLMKPQGVPLPRHRIGCGRTC
ncbi:MAG: integrase core domain-containing protein [Planctomycetota bacterium]